MEDGIRQQRPSSACSSTLAPPRLLGSTTGGRSELLVPIDDDLALIIVEADESSQSDLVDAALDSTAAIDSADGDPYGVVLWPAAQVVAREIASWSLGGKSVLELGCGTGLVAMAAAARGAASVLATDYRTEPLELLHASVARSSEQLGASLHVETRVFDITSDEALPAADVVVAADLLYLPVTSRALARRCVEALRSGAEVVVGDLGRPGRQAFLEELVAAGVRSEAARFTSCEGWTAGTARHELVSTTSAGPQAVRVGLLKLESGDMK